MVDEKQRVCILGGGFGGLYTALSLSQLPWENQESPEITLIDKNDRFVFLPLLYELISGEMQTWEIAPPFVEILANTGIRFQQGTITGIDIQRQQIQLQGRESLGYDRACIALGAIQALSLNKVDNAKEPISFRSLKDVYHLEEKLRALEDIEQDKIRVAIVGGGYSGIELACKLADRLQEKGRIRIIEKGNKILQNSPEFNREEAKKALLKRQIWLDLETTVDSIGSETISLLYKGQLDTIPVDVVVSTIGNQISSMIQSLPVKHDEQGRLQVHSTLQLPDFPKLFALGDVANMIDEAGQSIPPTAQAAIQAADYCAWNIWASLTQRPLLPLRYKPLGEMLTLGIDEGTIAGPDLKLSGSVASLVRRLAYLSRLPSSSHQITVGMNWIAGPLTKFFS